MTLRAIDLGGVQQKPSPAAADIEQPVTWLQPQLLADPVELDPLGVIKARLRRFKNGRRK